MQVALPHSSETFEECFRSKFALIRKTELFKTKYIVYCTDNGLLKLVSISSRVGGPWSFSIGMLSYKCAIDVQLSAVPLTSTICLIHK